MPRRNYLALAMIGSIEPVLLAGHPGRQAQGRDARALRPVRRRRREGRGQLRPPGLAPRAARERPGRDAPEPRPALHRSSTRASGRSSAARSRDKFGGIGIQVDVDPETGRLRVIAPMVGTPAYEAGILAGDQIVEIDGQSAEGMSPDKAVEVLTGRPGTEVKLSVLHEGSEEPETDHDHPGHHRSAQRPRRPPQARRSVGLHARQGQEDRLHPDHQLHPEHRRGAEEGPRTSSRKRGCRG